MKNIKLTEKDLTRIVSKVIKEQDEQTLECRGGSYWAHMGYTSTSGGYYKKAITPLYTFYIKGTARTQDQYCNV